MLLLLQHTNMRKDGHRNLSRRERQIMDILYQRGRATGAEIHQALPDAPTYSAVRAKLRVLEEKGHVRHQEEATALCLPAGCGPGHGAQIRAPPHGLHLLRRQRGRDRGGAAGPFGGQSGARRFGTHLPNDRNGEEARRTTMTWMDFVVRGTLLLAVGFAAWAGRMGV